MKRLLLVPLAALCLAMMDGHPTHCAGQGWQPSAQAPRDGSVIELCSTFGDSPWYGLFRWSQTRLQGGQEVSLTAPQWVSVPSADRVVEEAENLHFRPYAGEPAQYQPPPPDAPTDESTDVTDTPGEPTP